VEAPESAAAADTARARLTVAYDGTGFRGFAANRGVDTVAGALTDAISTVVRHPVELVAAGRTDAGVHARAQVVSTDLPVSTDLGRLVVSVNALCGPAISVREAIWAAPSFHARFDAVWRHYRYFVHNSPTPDPLRRGTHWHVREEISDAAVMLGSDALVGEHDFASFCRRPDPDASGRVPSMRRRVMSARWRRTDDESCEFDITANAFCHQMVRSVVGLLMEVGTGRRPASDVRAVLVARDRTVGAAHLAPPHGLVLWEVGYPEAPARLSGGMGHPYPS
jgi:tRNA pseudouridine38-40 synthase